jgi:hypothetical protein
MGLAITSPAVGRAVLAEMRSLIRHSRRSTPGSRLPS